MRNSSSRWRGEGIGWEDTILTSVDEPRNCVDPWVLGQSEWDQKLGMIECVFSLYDKMRWKWDDVYLLQSLPNIYSPPLCPPLLPQYHHTPAVARCRSTWRKLSCELGGHNRASLEMHLQVVIENICRYTWRPRSSELSDALAGPDRESLEMHWGWDRVNTEIYLEAMIDRDWRWLI